MDERHRGKRLGGGIGGVWAGCLRGWRAKARRYAVSAASKCPCELWLFLLLLLLLQLQQQQLMLLFYCYCAFVILFVSDLFLIVTV